MPRSFFVGRLRRVLGALSPDVGQRRRRSWARRFAGLEYLEGRALMATINASGVISATAAGPNTNYTITLTNASSSNSGIGTFWYAWVPGEDFLATSPVSVSPPPGWTDNITNAGPGDGFAIQFLANSPANDVQPGRSLTFSFTSADPPSSVDGNSVFYPGTPVDTAFVYPAGPFSDAGHQFVVTPISTPSPTPTPTPTPSPTPSPTPAPAPSPLPPPAPPVTVVGVQDVKNKKHDVTEIVVDLSGPVNSAQADNLANFRLTTANGKGSFTAKNSPVIKLHSAVFNAANDTITLTPRKAFTLNKAVELTINGMPPSGLQDTSGQPIDGNGDGVAGGNAVALIRRTGVVLNPVDPPATKKRQSTHAVLHATHTPVIPTPPVVISPRPPVSSMAPSPTPSDPPVAPPAPPVGISPISYGVFDAALARAGMMM
jgi:hypothetical protein